VTTRAGEEEELSAKAQFGEGGALDVSPMTGVFARACAVMKMNSPSATTSIKNMPKRFGEKNRIEPPLIQLECEGQ
jgi:hypothetical protein